MTVFPNSLPRVERNWLATAMIITRREVKDSLRDWRIMTPIFILTLIFPALLDVTASLAIDWAAQFDASIVGERLLPLMLMIVGFFPMSFSLVIALETFTGEKERNSIEPLLSMPISDRELYLGKMLAALFVPLVASYFGMTVYLFGLNYSVDWRPDPLLLSQMLLLTGLKGLVMVSGAVVVSSQTTSVRAANLLASFIIIPMALLLQAESILLFWGRYNVIWFIIAALLVVGVILVRMGVRIFNREDILSNEMDSLNLPSIWRDFKGYFLRSPQQALDKRAQPTFSLGRIWRNDIPILLKTHLGPMVIVAGLLVVAVVIGLYFSPNYPLPDRLIDLASVTEAGFNELDQVSMLPGLSFVGIFLHNVRALVLGLLLAIFSFGVIALILLMIPLGLLGYFAGAISNLGLNPAVFLAAFVLPHGILEIPAAIIATAFAFRIGAALVSPPEGMDVGQGLLYTLANYAKVFIFLVLPLLAVAAFIEAELTPLIVQWVY